MSTLFRLWLAVAKRGAAAHAARAAKAEEAHQHAASLEEGTEGHAAASRAAREKRAHVLAQTELIAASRARRDDGAAAAAAAAAARARRFGQTRARLATVAVRHAAGIGASGSGEGAPAPPSSGDDSRLPIVATPVSKLERRMTALGVSAYMLPPPFLTTRQTRQANNTLVFFYEMTLLEKDTEGIRYSRDNTADPIGILL